MIYTKTIPNMANIFIKGRGLRPISLAKGEYGMNKVITNPIPLKIKRYLPGLDWKKFL